MWKFILVLVSLTNGIEAGNSCNPLSLAAGKKMVNPGSEVAEFLTIDEKKETLADLLKHGEAEFYFIDLWASWCGPCIQEMPRTIKLQWKYANNPRIRFLFVSMDSEVRAWKNGMSRFGDVMNNQSSFLLLKGPLSEFGRKYKINMIPRYMLVRSNGEVLMDHAPRPGSPTAEKMIEKYLSGEK